MATDPVLISALLAPLGDIAGAWVIVSWRNTQKVSPVWPSRLLRELAARGAQVAHTGSPLPEWNVFEGSPSAAGGVSGAPAGFDPAVFEAMAERAAEIATARTLDMLAAAGMILADAAAPAPVIHATQHPGSSA